jgi:hypothetical protein
VSILLLAISAISGYVTFDRLQDLTFRFPDSSTNSERFVNGTVFTEEATTYQQRFPLLTKTDLVAKFGGTEFRERVWTAGSIHAASRKLLVSYVTTVVSICGAILCLLEIVLKKGK